MDASGFTELVFAVDKSALDAASVDYADFVLEDTSGGASNVDLYSLTPSSSVGDWDIYTVALSSITGVDFTSFKAFGIWHPKTGGSGGTFVNGVFYIDDVKFQ